MFCHAILESAVLWRGIVLVDNFTIRGPSFAGLSLTKGLVRLVGFFLLDVDAIIESGRKHLFTNRGVPTATAAKEIAFVPFAFSAALPFFGMIVAPRESMSEFIGVFVLALNNLWNSSIVDEAKRRTIF